MLDPDTPPKAIDVRGVRPPKPWTTGRVMRWVAIVLGFVISYQLAFWPSAQVASFDEFDAMELCRDVIRRASIDPQKADIPQVRAVMAGDSFRFVWSSSTQVLHLRNRIGLDAPADAVCEVSSTQKRVVGLTIGSQKVI